MSLKASIYRVGKGWDSGTAGDGPIANFPIEVAVSTPNRLEYRPFCKCFLWDFLQSRYMPETSPTQPRVRSAFRSTRLRRTLRTALVVIRATNTLARKILRVRLWKRTLRH